jgi:hypothetical protein
MESIARVIRHGFRASKFMSSGNGQRNLSGITLPQRCQRLIKAAAIRTLEMGELDELHPAPASDPSGRPSQTAWANL